MMTKVNSDSYFTKLDMYEVGWICRKDEPDQDYFEAWWITVDEDGKPKLISRLTIHEVAAHEAFQRL